jgi:hypothetical protein
MLLLLLLLFSFTRPCHAMPCQTEPIWNLERVLGQLGWGLDFGQDSFVSSIHAFLASLSATFFRLCSPSHRSTLVGLGIAGAIKYVLTTSEVLY